MKAILTVITLILLTNLSFGQTKTTVQKGDTKPFVLGEIRTIESNILGEKRTLNIYLPEGYNANDTITYPVIYLLDGSADEDFIHVVGLFQFNNFSWIDRVPKSIIIGIANVDRKRDFTYPTTIKADSSRYKSSGHSATFIAFLEKNYNLLLLTLITPVLTKHLLVNH